MRTHFLHVALVLSISSISAAAAQAQSGASPNRPAPVVTHVHCGPVYPAWWPYYGHGVTPLAANLYGMAAMTHAQGSYNLLTSQAMIQAAAARRMQIENHRAAVENHFQLREINKAYRQAQQRPSRSGTSAGPATRTASTKPSRPPIIDAKTGEVAWPEELQQDSYLSLRREVESILARRSPGQELAPKDRQRLSEAATELLSMLKGRIREIAPRDFMAAMRFLESVRLEARRAANPPV